VTRTLIDENLPRPLARSLRASGIDAEDVRDVGLRSKSDQTILASATQQGRALITADLGFGNLLKYPLGTHQGIILVRCPNSMPYPKVIELVVATLKSIPGEKITGNLVILEPGRIRFRTRGPGKGP
jgi:predicted nuclease of predicted toxin-antitoxin system